MITNMTTRWGEHNNPTHDFEPVKHLNKKHRIWSPLDNLGTYF